jgi:TPR repeat protein
MSDALALQIELPRCRSGASPDSESDGYPILALGAYLLSSMACLAEAEEAPAKKKSEADASFEAGIAAHQANNLPLAYKEFLAAATEGHVDSQFNVALMYEKGIGVGKDEKNAVLWYGKWRTG